jgi:hypothetical protein
LGPPIGFVDFILKFSVHREQVASLSLRMMRQVQKDFHCSFQAPGITAAYPAEHQECGVPAKKQLAQVARRQLDAVHPTAYYGLQSLTLISTRHVDFDSNWMQKKSMNSTFLTHRATPWPNQATVPADK